MKTILEVKDLIKKNGAMEVMGDLLFDHEKLLTVLESIGNIEYKKKSVKKVSKTKQMAIDASESEEQLSLF